ncbi:MAG: hypothetical protein IPP77_00935 [Bacteroidetes bacterium]|nr:hypothetical protein [Bacteroidota bacterium]
MQRLLTPIVSIIILLSTVSFESKPPSPSVIYKKDGHFTAMVDGKYFTVRDENRYSSELVNQSTEQTARTGTGTQKITKLVNHISFFGNQFFDESGNTAEERINFEYAFNENTMGPVEEGTVMLHFNNDKYSNIASETHFVITKRQWSPDRRYCVMTAEFDCKMRRWGVPASSQEVVQLKGKMEDITVTVPSWAVNSAADRVSMENW